MWKKDLVYSKITCEHEVHALNNSPVKSMGGIKKGKPTTVEQKSISICVNNEKVLQIFILLLYNGSRPLLRFKKNVTIG